jgi:predicted PurR-regulated permease PerM
VNAVPGIVHDLGRRLHETTGASSAEIGQHIQAFLRRYAGQPLRLLGPLASIGAGVASVVGALILMVITAYYIAIRPEPLFESILRVFPVDRRGRALEVMQRLRTAWLGWLQGVAFDMVISGTMLYVGLRLVGLDFAVVFAVLTGLLVVVPYFGAIAGAIPPVLLALTESPGRALVVLGIYVLVQEVEGHLVIPLVMSRTVNLHPAAIAIGVVLVGAVFGLPGLFVAVPIISTVTILTEELWVRPLERAPNRTLDRAPSDEPPAAAEKAPRRPAWPAGRQGRVPSSAR